MSTPRPRRLLIVHKEKSPFQYGSHTEYMDIDITSEFADELEELKYLVENETKAAVAKLQELIQQCDPDTQQESE